MSVTKDLANCCTDMVLLINEASYRSLDGFVLFLCITISLRTKILRAQHLIFKKLFEYNIKIQFKTLKFFLIVQLII